MNPRTVGALALHAVGNGQGSFYFLSMLTGRVLNRLHATALPMPDNVIDKVHRIAQQQKNNTGLVFADHNLNPDEDKLDDDDDDATYYVEDIDNERDEKDDELLYYDDVEDNDDNGLAPHDPHMADAPPPDNQSIEEAMLPGEVLGVEGEPSEIPGVEAPGGAGEHNMAMAPGIPGVGEEEAEPEIPRVREEEDEADDDVGSMQDEAVVEQPPPAPKVENNVGSRYNIEIFNLQKLCVLSYLQRT